MYIHLGQHFLVGIGGLSLTEEEKHFLHEENIGGVILFARNYESPLQLAKLVNSIQELRHDYPLFISVDHEGGRVMRFRKDFTQFPPMRQIGDLGSPKKCYDIHSTMAKELKAFGINLSYSPCADIQVLEENEVIGDRAFGDNADVVSKCVSSAIRGLQVHGVMACAKHFPGHGPTVVDSHFDLPRITLSLSEYEKTHFAPFHQAVKSRVESMMMAHLMVDALDSQWPTTLSPRVYSLLRQGFKFTKLILTDDMQMKAIHGRYGDGEAAYLALKAGADILIYKDWEVAKGALQVVKEKVKRKELPYQLLEEKYARVVQAKKTYGKDYRPVVPLEAMKVLPRS